MNKKQMPEILSINDLEEGNYNSGPHMVATEMTKLYPRLLL